MDAKKYFAKYYAKLNFEAILKSVLFGLVPGFAASFVIAAVAFFTEFEGLWPAVIAMPVITAAAALVIYFKKFKPTAMSNARRVDRVGLEERLITMIEYEGAYLAEPSLSVRAAQTGANRAPFRRSWTRRTHSP